MVVKERGEGREKWKREERYGGRGVEEEGEGEERRRECPKREKGYVAKRNIQLSIVSRSMCAMLQWACMHGALVAQYRDHKHFIMKRITGYNGRNGYWVVISNK